MARSLSLTDRRVTVALRALLRKPLLLLALFAAAGCGGGGGGGSSASGDGGTGAGAPAQIALWRSQMESFGRALCDERKISALGLSESSVWYYDGLRVFYQIADYTGDRSYERCAEYVWKVYGNYVIANRGDVPGWRVFPHGLAEYFYRTGDPRGRDAALMLASNSAFAEVGGGADFELSRETAYLIHAYLTAAELGSPYPERLSRSVDFALGHIQQWISSAPYVKPFMVGLTLEALVRYYEVSGDTRIPEAVRVAADWLWERGWRGSSRAFTYIECRNRDASAECTGPDAGPAADLNLLIAPAFAWLNRQFPGSGYDAKGAEVFSSGVENAYLSGGKQFSQSYRWSFDYVRWQQE